MFSSAKTKINSILALNLHVILHGAAAPRQNDMRLSQFWIEETARFLWSCLFCDTPHRQGLHVERAKVTHDARGKRARRARSKEATGGGGEHELGHNHDTPAVEGKGRKKNEHPECRKVHEDEIPRGSPRLAIGDRHLRRWVVSSWRLLRRRWRLRRPSSTTATAYAAVPWLLPTATNSPAVPPAELSAPANESSRR